MNLKNKKYLIIISLTVLSVFSLWSIFQLIEKSNKITLLELSLNDYKTKISSIEQSAADRISEAMIIKEKANRFILLEEKKLNTVLGSLFYYKNGFNSINGQFIKSMEIFNNTIKVNIQNNSDKTILPRFTIYFLNQYGFITASYRRSYTIFDEGIKPGETKIEEGDCYFSFEEPVYYSVRLEGI